MDLRALEHESISSFVSSCSGLFTQQEVLDYGSGKQPYRTIVEDAGGTYIPFDRLSFPSSITEEDTGDDSLLDYSWDVVLCTQVIQYSYDPQEFISQLWEITNAHGYLVITGPTNWPIVEKKDLWRFTPEGIRALLEYNGFVIERLDPRGSFSFGGDSRWITGWGAVARHE